jgi:hypothetical protein
LDKVRRGRPKATGAAARGAPEADPKICDGGAPRAMTSHVPCHRERAVAAIARPSYGLRGAGETGA